MRVALHVNGDRYDLELAPTRRLADVLRDELGLTGTKIGCAEGACGACAVLLDGRPVASCLLLAAAAGGHEVTTIEGLSRDGPTALQNAFVAEDALQCGYCTPGQIVTATALLAAVASPSAEVIRDALAGNLCRCGAYPKIERAVLRAAVRKGPITAERLVALGARLNQGEGTLVVVRPPAAGQEPR